MSNRKIHVTNSTGVSISIDGEQVYTSPSSPQPESLSMTTEGLLLAFEMRAYADNLVRSGVNGVPNAIYQWADKLDCLADPALEEAIERLEPVAAEENYYISARERESLAIVMNTLAALRSPTPDHPHDGR